MSRRLPFAETDWTASAVKHRLKEAAATFWAWHANQPRVGPTGFRPSWPEIVRQAAEAYGYDPVRTRPAPPAPDAIDRMEAALDWLNLVNDEDRRMLWAWANGAALWRIGQRFGKSERTMHNWIARAALVIAAQLNQADAARRRATAKKLRRGHA